MQLLFGTSSRRTLLTNGLGNGLPLGFLRARRVELCRLRHRFGHEDA